MKRIAQLLLGGAATLWLAATAADGRPPEDVIAGRQSNLRDLGSAFKELGDELKKKQPVPVVVQQYVGQIVELAKSRTYWFPPGTGPESGYDTKAKADIWKNQADFAQHLQHFAAEVEGLAKVAAGGDLAALAKQHRTLGGACKGCHDKYRERED